jgi:ElaB/YqjD/DUF883 family membrane-anchored ribosome-binding protein
MASELDALKNTIMTVVNGQVSPATMAVQVAQDAAKSIMAEAKYMFEMTKIVVPQQTKLAGEIATLEGQKISKEAEKAVKETEATIIDTAIDAQEKALDVKKKAESIGKKQQNKLAAKIKAQGGEYTLPSNNSEDGIRKLKENA